MLVTDEKQIANYYQALLNREPAYVGSFYVGVKTTSIFCIATCRARKPKADNVEFFTTFKEALDCGYRPCKICRPTENEHIVQVKREVEEYFAGNRKRFDVKLDTPGTEFQNKVWQALHAIPYGETSTYQQQAQRISQPTAVRVVATANGYNRVAIIIPCHRVIGKNGNLTGYAGGLERKQWLIEHEKRYS